MISLLELINRSLTCSQKDAFKSLMIGLNNLISCDFAVCGLGRMINSGNRISHDSVNISYPDEWLELYFNGKYAYVDPIVKENFRNFRLQYWFDTCNIFSPPANLLHTVESFRLKKGYSHGIRGMNRSEGSVFSFSGDFLDRDSRTEAIVKLIIPHYHQALMRIANGVNKKGYLLSTREREILNWVKFGKSSWDISVILDISQRTVNFHVSNIMQKLDAANRSHAVAIALDAGLIKSE